MPVRPPMPSNTLRSIEGMAVAWEALDVMQTWPRSVMK